MILNDTMTEFDNVRFASPNKSLDKARKKISRRYVGLYGIHSVSAAPTKSTIKVFVHNLKEVPHTVKSNIAKMAKKFKVTYVESKRKRPDDYHLEKVFEQMR